MVLRPFFSKIGGGGEYLFIYFFFVENFAIKSFHAGIKCMKIKKNKILVRQIFSKFFNYLKIEIKSIQRSSFHWAGGA